MCDWVYNDGKSTFFLVGMPTKPTYRRFSIMADFAVSKLGEKTSCSKHSHVIYRWKRNIMLIKKLKHYMLKMNTTKVIGDFVIHDFAKNLEK